MANVPPQGGRKHPQQEYVQIDTSNILFICGGAFDGLSEIIEQRRNRKSLGFRASLAAEVDSIEDDPFSHVLPDDLQRYGLIPEFIGRLPVTAALAPLDEAALVRILTEPRNALTRQYRRFFELDGVGLHFTEGALAEIARQAIERKTGARALRTIIEEATLDIMYEVPSQREIEEVVITEATIRDKQAPDIRYFNRAA